MHAGADVNVAHLPDRPHYARLALETAVKWLYRHDGSLMNPYETTLSAHIHEPSFKALAGDRLVAKARVIKKLGNTAAHGRSAVPFQKAVTSLRELFHFSYWLARSYAKGAKPGVALAFSADALTRTTSVLTKTLAQLQEIARRFAETVKARADAEAKRLASEEDRAKLETELAALHAEIAKVKAVNAALPDTHDYSESETRDAFIDILLSEAGWVFSKPGQDTEFRVTGMPNAKGEGFVDYVLWGDDGKPLGIVEAKRSRKDARTGQQQAKLYADCLEVTFGQRPIIFYSNGYDHWIWDDHRYPPRPVQGFLTKDELELAIRRRTTLKPLNAAGIDPKIVERFYQTRAIRRVAEAFEKDRLRRALLVMATGTGKTRTVIALADLLMRANWARRVLFLADRVALVNQAVNAFKTHLRAASPVNLVTERVGAAVVLPGLGTVGLESFRMRARQFLKGHESHIAVLKLRRNEPLTPTDLSELERIFAESGADPSEIEKVRKEGGFGLFVRSLVGMDREAAKRAFDSFMLGKALTGNQIEFLNLVIDYLTERGTMDPKLLYESPFTDFDPLGVEGVFDRDQASIVIGLLRDVNARAAA